MLAARWVVVLVSRLVADPEMKKRKRLAAAQAGAGSGNKGKGKDQVVYGRKPEIASHTTRHRIATYEYMTLADRGRGAGSREPAAGAKTNLTTELGTRVSSRA